MFLAISVISFLSLISYVYLEWLPFEVRSMAFAIGLMAFMLVAYRKPSTVNLAQPVKAPQAPTAQAGAPSQSVPQAAPRAAQTAQTSLPSGKPIVPRGTLKWLMMEEIELINNMFRAHKIFAKAFFAPTATIPLPHLVTRTSFIAYRLDVKPGQKIDKIEKVLLELSEAITDLRKRSGYMQGRKPDGSKRTKILVRYRNFPPALEVPHYDPEALTWQHASFALPPETALLGRVYDFGSAEDCRLNFKRAPHWLIAGMSGYGKSTLMRLILTGLVLNNAPGRMKLMLIDLKNSDLWLFEKLPHAMGYAQSQAEARPLFDKLVAELEARKKTRNSPYRIVVAIDELAQIKEKDIRAQLTLLILQGREYEINIIGGTQEPSAEAIGSEINNGFQARVVTRVASADTAAFITKTAGSGAEQISEEGDFLILLPGGEIERMKVFDLSREDNKRLIAKADSLYGLDIPVDTAGYKPDISVDMTGYKPDISSGYAISTQEKVVFPLDKVEPLTDAQKEALIELSKLPEFQYQGKPSVRRLTIHVFGSRDPKRDRHVADALFENEE